MRVLWALEQCVTLYVSEMPQVSKACIMKNYSLTNTYDYYYVFHVVEYSCFICGCSLTIINLWEFSCRQDRGETDALGQIWSDERYKIG